MDDLGRRRSAVRIRDDGAERCPVSQRFEAVLDRLQRHYHDTNSFTAKFNEEIATVGAPKRQRQGTVSFRKPGRMRWEFETPEKQTIVSDGETLYSYDPDLNQVVETPLKQALKSSSATSFLLGIGNINRDFKAAFANPPTPTGLIDLILDAKNGGYKIEVGLDPKTLQPHDIDAHRSAWRRDQDRFHRHSRQRGTARFDFHVQSPARRRHRNSTCLALTI